MKIGAKIASAIIGVTVVSLVAMLVLNKWSFDEGFLDYLNEQEQQRLDRFAARLASDFQISGGWSSAQERIDEFFPSTSSSAAASPTTSQ